MSIIGTILAVAVIGLVCWFMLWLVGHILFGNSKQQAQTLEERMWNKQGARSAERSRALAKAQMTGDYSEYNALKVQHDAEFRADYIQVNQLEMGISDEEQAELDAGINPYKVSPAPSGKLARR